MRSQKKRPKGLTIKIAKDGVISEIATITPLDLIYKRIFDNARRAIRRNPDNIENAIKVVVFGCFWLETRTNSVVCEAINSECSKTEFGDRIWMLTKRANIIEKLTLISELCNAKQLQEFKLLKPKIRQAFDLRNRLAHFKGDDEIVAKDISADEFSDFLDNTPDPELIRLLTSSEIGNGHVPIIVQCGKWLSQVEKSILKSAAQPGH